MEALIVWIPVPAPDLIRGSQNDEPLAFAVIPAKAGIQEAYPDLSGCYNSVTESRLDHTLGRALT